MRSSLQPDEIKNLHSTLAGRRVIDWLKWRDENEKLIVAFVASTPSKRRKSKHFQAQKLLLTLAGIQHCMEAYALLKAVNNNYLEPGLSYRGMAAAAGLAYQQLFDVDIPYWPFEETESPFIDDPSYKKSVSA